MGEDGTEYDPGKLKASVNVVVDGGAVIDFGDAGWCDCNEGYSYREADEACTVHVSAMMMSRVTLGPRIASESRLHLHLYASTIRLRGR